MEAMKNDHFLIFIKNITTYFTPPGKYKVFKIFVNRLVINKIITLIIMFIKDLGSIQGSMLGSIQDTLPRLSLFIKHPYE